MKQYAVLAAFLACFAMPVFAQNKFIKEANAKVASEAPARTEAVVAGTDARATVAVEPAKDADAVTAASATEAATTDAATAKDPTTTGAAAPASASKPSF